jgi:hypothetical protein
MTSEQFGRRFRVWISAVPDHVANVGSSYGLQDFGVYSGIVITGKTARGLHGRNNLAEQYSPALTWITFPSSI